MQHFKISSKSKLDKVKEMPTFAIDYLSLLTIPRSLPEELNDITLCDRLNQLEQKVTNL